MFLIQLFSGQVVNKINQSNEKQYSSSVRFQLSWIRWPQHHRTFFRLMEWEKCPHFKFHLCIYSGDNESHSPRPFTSHQPHFISDCGNLTLYVSLDHQTKLPESSPWLMRIGNSSPYITFIQSSTVHDCFSLDHCNLVFFCLGVSDGLSLAFQEVNPRYISFFNILFILAPDFRNS